ncbi:MAG TPA: glycosyltransferase family 2 protein [Dictyoglomaceae bacterium]|nr:glycosyltransferase family 2 protein [Dictyoglomaceae bacterium]HOL39032.1 glycosyltransferase family 2 protein [Dictyoglomaceae bacterium]HOP94371.1 glycosyltransferase family 2 protein [Dictyoglomaceae bacterium]HPP15792.1 glycosyltransferase family 2 protein [Dictyoglomaceae bacterium]HPU42781.1 glycosyltransferase family 2 protein [Dictyoglomaceae bacterium]
MENIRVSYIIPVKNEEGTLQELYSKIKDVSERLSLSFEIIFIDDGSTDNSFEIMRNLSVLDKRVKIIKFRRNFGKASALSAGFEKANGEIIITMDADLQDDPKEIPEFLEKIEEGYDMVSGWKKNRRDPLSKRLPSKIFNKITSLLTGVKIHDFNCGFKAYRKEVIENIDIYGELYRYIPALVNSKGFRIGEIEVEHHPRVYGKSKYGFERILKGFLDLITVVFLTRFLRRPMHFFGGTGIVFFTLGFLINLGLTIYKFVSGALIGGRPLLTLGVLLMILGVQFLSIGLLGEMLNNITHGRKKDYSILEEIGFE